jgi:hypothetical protein
MGQFQSELKTVQSAYVRVQGKLSLKRAGTQFWVGLLEHYINLGHHRDIDGHHNDAYLSALSAFGSDYSHAQGITGWPTSYGSQLFAIYIAQG